MVQAAVAEAERELSPEEQVTRAEMTDLSKRMVGLFVQGGRENLAAAQELNKEIQKLSRKVLQARGATARESVAKKLREGAWEMVGRLIAQAAKGLEPLRVEAKAAGYKTYTTTISWNEQGEAQYDGKWTGKIRATGDGTRARSKGATVTVDGTAYSPKRKLVDAYGTEAEKARVAEHPDQASHLGDAIAKRLEAEGRLVSYGG